MGPTYARVFPTGENRMARRIILNHPFISGCRGRACRVYADRGAELDGEGDMKARQSDDRDKFSPNPAHSPVDHTGIPASSSPKL